MLCTMGPLFFAVAVVISPVSAFTYGVDPIRGVNLGGWLILEKWMVPSMFQGLPDTVVDEWTFCKYLGKTEATSRLTKHWGSYITEKDIVALKNAGINHVRIPFGYWAF